MLSHLFDLITKLNLVNKVLEVYNQDEDVFSDLDELLSFIANSDNVSASFYDDGSGLTIEPNSIMEVIVDIVNDEIESGIKYKKETIYSSSIDFVSIILNRELEETERKIVIRASRFIAELSSCRRFYKKSEDAFAYFFEFITSRSYTDNILCINAMLAIKLINGYSMTILENYRQLIDIINDDYRLNEVQRNTLVKKENIIKKSMII